MKLFKHPSALQQHTGEDLVSLFQSALTNLSTAQVASYEAERSEQEALHAVNDFANNQAQSPGLAQERLIKGSLDAHVKKIQAANIASFTKQELTIIEHQAKAYIGKRARFTARTQSAPFESVWQHSQNDKLTYSKVTAAVLTGKLEDLSIERNVVLIKPGYFQRMINPRRLYYAVRVIDMNTMEPSVSIRLF